MRKIFDYSLNVFIFLSPLFLFRDFKPTLSRGLFFIVGSLILFILSLNLEPKRVLRNHWLMIFLLLMLMRCFLDNGMVFGPEEWLNFWYAMAGFFYVLCGFLLFRTVYCYVDDIRKHLYPMIGVMLMNFPLVICQHLQYDFFWTRVARFNPVCGFFDLPQQLSQYSVMSVPILSYINPFLILIPLLFLFLAKEVSAFMALFIGGIFYLFFRNKNRIIFILIFLSLLFGYKNISHVKAKWYTRPIMWGRVLELSMKKPYLGYGYQSFNSVVIGNEDKIGNIQNPGAFNDYLHTFLEFGIFPLIAILLFLKEYFVKFVRKRGKSLLLICLGTSVFIGLTNMLGQGLIRYASTAGLFIILLAFFCIQLEKECQDGRYPS